MPTSIKRKPKQAKLDQLKTELAGTQQEIATAQDMIEQIRSDIAAAGNKSKTTTSSQLAIAAKQAEKSAELLGLNAAVSVLEEQRASLKQAIAVEQEREAVAELRKENEQAISQIAALQPQLDQAVAQVENILKQIEAIAQAGQGTNRRLLRVGLDSGEFLDAQAHSQVTGGLLKGKYVTTLPELVRLVPEGQQQRYYQAVFAVRSRKQGVIVQA